MTDWNSWSYESLQKMAWLAYMFLAFFIIAILGNTFSVLRSLWATHWVDAASNTAIVLILLWLYFAHRKDMQACVRVYKGTKNRGEVL